MPSVVTTLISAEGSEIASQRFEFDALGRIRSAKRFGPDGVAIWAARFEDYRRLGEESFAFHVELSFPRVDAKAEITFKTVELNPDLPSDVFVLPVPRGVQ